MANSPTPGTTDLSSTGDYTLKTFSIISSDGVITEIGRLIVNLNIYEDIFTPYVSGDATLGDSLDIVSSLFLHGNEFAFLEIQKPSLDQPISKFFRIYKVSDRTFDTQSLQNLKIYFCSEELFLSTQKYMRKSYKGMAIDAMIKDILNNQLKVSPTKMKDGIFTSTAANYDIIVPRMQPLEAALWLNTRAYNDNETLYFFFENRDGYNFTSLEKLVQQPVYKTYTRSPKVDPDPSENVGSINYIKFMTDHDVLKGNRYGQFSTSVWTFDMISRQYKRTDTSALQLKLTSMVNPYFPANLTTNRFEKTLFDNPESMQKFVPTTDSDPNRNPIHPEAWLAKTALKLAQLNALRVVLNIPSDFMLKVGMVIALRLPKMVPQLANESFDFEPYKSCNYIITSVHHGMSGQQSSTTLELLSDSLGQIVPATADALGALKYVKAQ